MRIVRRPKRPARIKRMHSPDGPLELRFYNGRQLSEHEQDVIEQYLKWAKTTKLGPPKV